MNSKEIYALIVEELEADRLAVASTFSYSFEELTGLFLMRQRVAPELRGAVYRDLFLMVFEFLVGECEKVLAAVGTGVMWNREFSEWVAPSHLHRNLLDYLIPKAAGELSEVELGRVVGFTVGRKTIRLQREWDNAIEEETVNAAFVHFGSLLKLLREYQRGHSISAGLLDEVRALKTGGLLKGYEFYVKDLDLILGNEPVVDEAAKEKRTLSAEVLATDKKKWKWLQEHPLGFGPTRKEFFGLLEALSQVDFLDHFCVEAGLREMIDGFDKVAFEAFVLDVHRDSCADGGKRSPWFVTERAVAYQIFVWMLFQLKTANCYAVLTKIAEKCFTKISGSGATSRLLGDVVLRLLYESQTVEGLGVLLKLKSRNKYPVFLESLEKAITWATRYSRIDPKEVEDYFIADYGLVDGRVQQAFGEYVSEIKVDAFDTVEMVWTKAGTELKSEPSAVKSKFGPELKVWKSTYADLKKDIAGQKMRLESLWRGMKTWEFEVWKRYLFDHALMQLLVRKLIWTFEKDGQAQHGYWLDGGWVDSGQQPMGSLEGSKVSLWHPAVSSVAEVQAWRGLMLEREIRQPFKQAFREVYIVTGAEIATSTFSNRFRGHVLRHHKLVALAQQRRWDYSVSDIYSGANSPSITFPEFKISCTLDVENHFDYAVTGAVHFRDSERNVALRMEDVPQLIFAEAMRDVDLFVGVCTIGVEEEWREELFRNYWQGYSHGELNETAQTRKAVIEAMLPKLKIREKCEVMDRFLRVKGQLRTYKIHFGSGNILMEPNDQYLCIIPDLKHVDRETVYLPFEGDSILSIVISKAMLLAEDDKITDAVILGQLNRG